MIIEQTIDIPDSHRLMIEVPREVPAGRVVLAFQCDPHIPETMLLSESSLAKEWDTPEEDEAWADL